MLLFSGSAVRFFNDAGRGPYMLFGLTAAHIEFGSSSDVAGGLLLGVGSAIRVGKRTSIAPELRAGIIDGGMFLVRPTVALLHIPLSRHGDFAVPSKVGGRAFQGPSILAGRESVRLRHFSAT